MPGGAQLARAEQCAQAIMSAFPCASQEGWFHRGGASDIYQLPKTATFGECKVMVDLADTAIHPFKSSWPAIWSMALMLKDACAVYSPSPVHTGTAWTAGSLSAGIVISLGSSVYDTVKFTGNSTSSGVAQS